MTHHGPPRTRKPGDSSILADLERLRQDGRIREAIHLSSSVLADDIRDPAIASYLATLLAEDEQFDRADRMFTHALKLDGDNPHTLLNYGTFLGAAGRYEEARPILETEFARIQARIAKAHEEAQAVTDFFSDNDEDVAEDEVIDEDAFIASLDLDFDLAEAQARRNLCALNLAKTCEEMGDLNTTVHLVTPLLTHEDPDTWHRADDILNEAIEARGDDIVDFVEDQFHAKAMSPTMLLFYAQIFHVDDADDGADDRVEIRDQMLDRIRVILETARTFLAIDPLREVFAKGTPGGDLIREVAESMWPFAVDTSWSSQYMITRFEEDYAPVYGESLRPIIKQSAIFHADRIKAGKEVLQDKLRSKSVVSLLDARARRDARSHGDAQSRGNGTEAKTVPSAGNGASPPREGPLEDPKSPQNDAISSPPPSPIPGAGEFRNPARQIAFSFGNAHLPLFSLPRQDSHDDEGPLVSP